MLLSEILSPFSHSPGDGALPLAGRWMEVGQPVTRLPPHGSRRAELPHRALQRSSLPHSFAIPSREVCINFLQSCLSG